jgi:hypothetical protein
VFYKRTSVPLLSGTQLRALLQQHLTANIMRVGARFLQQSRGIPQGSLASTLLCRCVVSWSVGVRFWGSWGGQGVCGICSRGIPEGSLASNLLCRCVMVCLGGVLGCGAGVVGVGRVCVICSRAGAYHKAAWLRRFCAGVS